MLRFFVLLALIVVAAQSATINWSGGAGNGLWGASGNWDSNTVPTAADDVIINWNFGNAVITVGASAVCNSLTIGGGQYQQTVNLVSSLAVGSGGVNVQQNGQILLEASSTNPFSSAGPVSINPANGFTFQSGAITGAGKFVVEATGSMQFTTSALKLITGTELLILGQANIQASTIQIDNHGSFVNEGSIYAFGQITLLTSDNTGLFSSAGGNITYTGQSTAQPLSFQVSSVIANNFYISGGQVNIQSPFSSNATVFIAAQATLQVIPASTPQTFNEISGQGTIDMAGNSVFGGVVSIGTLLVDASGTVQFNGVLTVGSAVVQGKLTLGSKSSANTVALNGGVITGTGPLTAQTVTFGQSSSGSTNSFISAPIFVQSQAQITSTPVVLLLSGGGNLQIQAAATFTISKSTQFTKQTGSPAVTIQGALNINVAGGTVSTNVDFLGAGQINVNAGTFYLQADNVKAGQGFVGAGAWLIFGASTVAMGAIQGSGGVNVTSGSTPSSFGQVQADFLGLLGGPVNMPGFAANEVLIETAQVGLSGAASATNLMFYGGGLSSQGAQSTVTCTSVEIGGSQPKTINNVSLQATQLQLTCSSDCTITASNNAAISVGSQTGPVKKVSIV